MKIVKFFSIALVGSFLVASSVLANDVVKSTDSKTAENSIREQVAGALSQVNANDNSVVYVYFSVSETKGFELVDVKGNDAELTDKVKSVLASEAIVTTAVLDGKYSVKVRFADFK